MEWIYKQPVEITFGPGTAGKIPKLLRDAARPLIVTGPTTAGSGLLDSLGIDASVDVYTDVSPNPDVKEVNECSRCIRRNGNDLIVAIGGGSVLDLAKAASITAEDISAFHGTGVDVPAEHIDVIAVPTTAGTGSEVTNTAVLTDRRSGQKMPIVADAFFARAAIVDPLLTVSMPPQLTAITGIDVLCHGAEGYWSKGARPICNEAGIKACQLVFEYLPAACQDPDNIEARVKMAEASLMGGLAFFLPKTTASHACSFPLTAIYDIPHGEACGLTLDYFARVNGQDSRTADLARALGFASAEEFADGICLLKQRLGLRMDMKDLHLSGEDIDELVVKSQHANLLNNPVKITSDILYDLYEGLR